jgi:ribosomal protein S18 acetylase RimI-like enzyme
MGRMTGLSVSYIDKLQKENADDLAFYPLTTLEAALLDGHIISCEENGESAGYLWFGALRGGYDVVIYQACVDYQARRRHLGYSMVAELIGLAKASGCTGIRLKCASSSESNEFWQQGGFYCTSVTEGGRKRARKINHYRTDVMMPLFLPTFAEPSTDAIDLRSYQRSKRDGEEMASRFSRKHYGSDAGSW